VLHTSRYFVAPLLLDVVRKVADLVGVWSSNRVERPCALVADLTAIFIEPGTAVGIGHGLEDFVRECVGGGVRLLIVVRVNARAATGDASGIGLVNRIEQATVPPVESWCGNIPLQGVSHEAVTLKRPIRY
jgi:hypothetical protein